MLSNKNTLSIKSLKKFNIYNIENKISELQQESARYISVSISDLKRLPFTKLEKIKTKFLNHIDKLLNQDLYLQQLSSKCSFLQENCVLKDISENESEEEERSESLSTLLRESVTNTSKITLCKNEESEEESGPEFGDSDSENPKSERDVVDKSKYDNLYNEHLKALETIKELKRKLVQKHEEENLSKSIHFKQSFILKESNNQRCQKENLSKLAYSGVNCNLVRK